MNWEILLKKLQAHGYKGKEDDLDAVKAYVEENFDGLTDKGKTIDPDQLFADRERKETLDFTTESNAAEVQRQVDEALATVGRIDKADLNAETKNEVVHDTKVTVVKMMLAEDPKGGFDHIGHFGRDVVKACTGQGISQKLAEWTKASLGQGTFAGEQVGPDGGFAVPTQMSDVIREYTEGEDSLLPLTDSINIDSNSIELPIDEETQWASTGITASLLGEADVIAQSKPVLKLRRFSLRKVAVLVPASDELFADSSAIASYLPRKAGEKLGFKIDELIVRGNGGAEPMGLLNSASVIEVAAESGQDAKTIVATNVFKMFSRMYAPFRRDAVWLYQQDAEPQLFTLQVQAKTDAGTAVAGGGPILFANTSTGGLGRLLGSRMIATQHAATVGSVGDIIYWSPRQYAVVRKAAGVEAAQSMHLWFDQAVQAFRFIFRFDGAPWSENTITPRDGSNTMSSIITLAVRS